MVALSSLKSAKETLEKGNPLSWGQVVDVTEKNNPFDIGYHPSSRLLNPEDQKKFFPISKVFNSVGFQHNDLVAVIEMQARRSHVLHVGAHLASQ